MNADDRNSLLNGFGVVAVDPRANTSGQRRAARSQFVSIRYFHRYLNRVGKHLRPNQTARAAPGKPRGVERSSSCAQFLYMTQMPEHDSFIQCAEQMSARVPASHAIESRPRRRLHI